MDSILQNKQHHMLSSGHSYVLYKSEKLSALYPDKRQVLKGLYNHKSAVFLLLKLGRTIGSS